VSPPNVFTTTLSGISNVLKNDVGIGQSIESASGKIRKEPLGNYVAIWDTGATCSGISKKVVDECALKPIAMIDVHHSGGKSRRPVYLASIYLPNGVCFPRVRVTEVDIIEADLLIGMDIINRGDFAVTNARGKTRFSFRWPSKEAIDFVEDYKMEQRKVTQVASRKVPRNAPCPCGSGKKYKNCHGKVA